MSQTAEELAGVKEPESPEELAEFYASEAPTGTYEIFLPNGRPISCRYAAGYWELRAFFRGLVEFWAMWSDEDNLLEELKAYAPPDWATAYAAFLLHFWSDAPTKWSQKASLLICRNAWAMESVKSQIEKKGQSILRDRTLQEIEEEGKDSAETTSFGFASESASTSSTATPTS